MWLLQQMEEKQNSNYLVSDKLHHIFRILFLRDPLLAVQPLYLVLVMEFSQVRVEAEGEITTTTTSTLLKW